MARVVDGNITRAPFASWVALWNEEAVDALGGPRRFWPSDGGFRERIR